MRETTVADVIAAELAGAGARWVAGVAGGEVLHLADALARAGLTYLAVRHESAGGFVAAEGFGGLADGGDDAQQGGAAEARVALA